MSDDVPLPDQLAGALHPRETPDLIGQGPAQAAFLEAFNTGKLHHAWLLTGPRGVGKATLAWSIARFLLATPESNGGMFDTPPPVTLDIPQDHPVARRILAGGEPAVHLVRRGGVGSQEKDRDKAFSEGRFSKEIRVDEIRALSKFLHLSAADGGHRVVIIDDADALNTAAANALLKMLEEPPARTTLLLISHQPSGLLPTIKSRCRTLRLGTLSTDEMTRAIAASGVAVQGDPAALAELSGGSVGGALRLSLMDGLAIYAELISLIGTLPRLDRARALKLSEAAAQRGAEAKLALLFELMNLALNRLARTGATGAPPTIQAAPNEAEILVRLAPSPAQGRIWAEVAADVSARAQHGMAVNLDPAALVLDTLFKLGDSAPR